MSKRLVLMALLTMAIILPQQASADCGSCHRDYRGDRRSSPHYIEATAHKGRKEQKEMSKRERRRQDRRERQERNPQERSKDMNAEIDALHSRVEEMECLLHEVADLMVSDEKAQ